MNLTIELTITRDGCDARCLETKHMGLGFTEQEALDDLAKKLTKHFIQTASVIRIDWNAAHAPDFQPKITVPPKTV